MNIYEVLYKRSDEPNIILRKAYIVCRSYTEVEIELVRSELEFVQSITYLGPVFNSEVLKDG